MRVTRDHKRLTLSIPPMRSAWLVKTITRGACLSTSYDFEDVSASYKPFAAARVRVSRGDSSFPSSSFLRGSRREEGRAVIASKS